MGDARIYALWGQSQRHRGKKKASSYLGTSGGSWGQGRGHGAAAPAPFHR